MQTILRCMSMVALLGLMAACGVPSSTSTTSSGSGATTVVGSGKIVAEPRTVHDFNAVTVSGSSRVIITQGDQESLTISADDNILPYLTSEVKDGRLTLGIKPNTSLRSTQTVVYRLGVKALKDLDLSGNTDVEAAKLTADRLKVTHAGNGTTTIAGTVAHQEINLSGNTNFNGKNLVGKEAVVDAAGTGRAVVRISDKLDAHASGTTTIEYIGNPTVTKDEQGTGKVRQRSAG